MRIDLVPLDDVARWRSYVYLVATIGRSSGAPLGGLLNDTVGWRWSFIVQSPLAVLALLIVLWGMPALSTPGKNTSDSASTSPRSKLKRVDFMGSIALAVSITAFLLALNLASKRLQFDSLLGGVIGIWIGSAILFGLIEVLWAREPIFPLQILLNRGVVSSYLIQGLQSGAQVGVR